MGVRTDTKYMFCAIIYMKVILVVYSTNDFFLRFSIIYMNVMFLLFLILALSPVHLLL